MKMTKQMAWIAVLAFSTGTLAAKAQTSPTTKDDLFAGTEIFAKGASDVTEITMDPDTLDLVGGKDGHRAHNMILNVVHTYTYDKPGMYRIEDVDAFRNKLNTGDWHCSVHTRDLKNGSSTDVCNKRRADGLSESAIVTVEPKSLTFIHTIRKRGDNDHSEIGDFHFSGLDSLAMLHTDINPNIHIDLSGLDSFSFDGAKMQADMAKAMAKMPKIEIDGAEMQKRMEDAKKAMDDARRQFDEKQKDKNKQPE
jgi:hypothetical protein